MKKNRDFSAGRVWDEKLDRYLVEICYPDQTRKRKRFRNLKKAQTLWAREMTAIEEGTWNNHFVAKNVTLGQAFDEYREHCKVHNRSYRSYTEVALRSIEQHFGRDMPLARITATAVEKFKISRVAAVSQQTVDHSLAVFKAFFNWCDVHDVFHVNPVRKVRMFHPNNAVAVRKPQLSEMLLKAAIRTTGLVHGEQDASLRTPAPALIGLFPVTRLYGRFCSHKCKQRRLPAREALHVEARLIVGQSPYFEARGLDDLFGYNLRGRILELHDRVSL